MAKERKRERINPTIPAPGFAFTPQMVLRAFCNWPKTPLAPKSASKIPMIVARKFLFGCDAFWAIPWTTSMALLSKKVAHLFCHFSPSAGGIVVENEANDCQEQKNKRREGEHEK
jgi:hypothetical protein